jgi:hypothetical protein
MVDYSILNPMEVGAYVQQGFDKGRERGEGMYLNRLMGEAYTAPDAAARTSALQKLAKTHGQQAIAADSMFQQRDADQQARRRELLTQRAGILAAMPVAQRAAAWPSVKADLVAQDPAMASLPDVYDDAQFGPVIQRLAGQGSGDVFAQKVGADGFIYNAMRDGRMVNTGIKADRQMWFANNPGVDPYLVSKDGSVNVLGGGQPPPAREAAPSPLANSGGDPKADSIMKAANAMIAAGVPEAQVDAFIQQSMQAAGMQPTAGGAMPPQAAPPPAGGGMPAPMGGGGPAPVGAPVGPPTLDRVPIDQYGGGTPNPLRRPMPAPAGSAPPSGYRARPDGSLEFIPGGPADPANRPQAQDKPIPVGALRLQLEAQEALSVAEGLDGQLAKYEGMIGDGSLDLGPVDNIASTARNALGVSSPNSRNYADFRAALEKMRNDSLRLNKGVQTEGDAQRAWNELTASINDPQVVKQRLATIRELNKRAIQLQQEKMRAIESNYRGKDAAPEDDINDLLQLYGDNI